MNFFIVIRAVFYRTLIKLIRRPVTLAFSLVQPMMWMFFFGFLFHRFTLEAQYSEYSYLDFLLPGICCMTILFGASQSGITLIRDIQTGIFFRMHSTPASNSIILFGKITADIFRLSIQGIIVGFLGIFLGAQTNVHWSGLVLSLCLILLFAFAYSSISCLVAIKTKRPEMMATFIHVINMPLLFTSTALVPIKQMPDWLAQIAQLNPLSLVVDQLRNSMILNQFDYNPTYFLFLGGLALVFFSLSSLVIRRTEFY